MGIYNFLQNECDFKLTNYREQATGLPIQSESLLKSLSNTDLLTSVREYSKIAIIASAVSAIFCSWSTSLTIFASSWIINRSCKMLAVKMEESSQKNLKVLRDAKKYTAMQNPSDCLKSLINKAISEVEDEKVADTISDLFNNLFHGSIKNVEKVSKIGLVKLLEGKVFRIELETPVVKSVRDRVTLHMPQILYIKIENTGKITFGPEELSDDIKGEYAPRVQFIHSNLACHNWYWNHLTPKDESCFSVLGPVMFGPIFEIGGSTPMYGSHSVSDII